MVDACVFMGALSSRKLVVRIMKEGINRNALRVWLEGFSSDTPCGIRGNCTECPVAEYLKHIGAQDPYVSAEHIFLERYSPNTEIPYPHWLDQLIAGVDGRAIGPCLLVTAGEVLSILKGIPDDQP